MTNRSDRRTPVPVGTPTARRRAASASYLGAAITVVFGLSAALLIDSLPLSVQYLPLALSVVLFGLPHGAVDHLVLPRARGDPVTPRAVAFVGSLYLVVGGAYALVWMFAPALAFALFIAVTLTHWGQGDVYALIAFTDATHLETRLSRVLTLVVRGGLPMLVPLVAFPDQYAFVAETLVGLFDPAAAAALEPAFSPEVRVQVAVGLGSFIFLSLTLGFFQSMPGNRTSWFVDVVETLSLVVYFAVVPPILAIGLYFCFWHSFRHVLRTMLVDPVTRNAVERRVIRSAVKRFVRDALPLTIGGVIVLGGIALLVGQTPASVHVAIGLYLITIAVLTLPHVIIVTLLDLEERIWE